MTTHYDLPEPGNLDLMRSAALSECIRQDIDKQGGVISFSTFMALALYHPQFGYYCRPDFNLGQHGDFTTAPEISPLFAQCFAKQCVQIADHLNDSNILELGAGTGRFAHDLLKQLARLHALPQHYYIYEISLALRQKQQAFLQANYPDYFPHITWLHELPSAFTGTIIANEVLDALPVTCFTVQENGIKERCVAVGKEGFIWQEHEPLTPELAEQATRRRDLYSLTKGYESEVNLEVPRLIHTLAKLLTHGVILLADYGYGQAEYYRPERRRGSLTCFYQHRRHDNPLILPGLQDMTAHVDFTSAIEEAASHGCTLLGYTTQVAFLLATGLLQLAEEQEKNLSPLEVVNAHTAIKLLTLPSEMGERIKIMGLGKGVTLSLLGFSLQDRRRDL